MFHLIDIKSLLVSGELYERVSNILVAPSVPTLRGSGTALAEKEVRITVVRLHLDFEARRKGLARERELWVERREELQ